MPDGRVRIALAAVFLVSWSSGHHNQRLPASNPNTAMLRDVPADLVSDLQQLDHRDANFATRFVDLLLSSAERQGITDIHFQPVRQGIEVRWRRDGVLQPVGLFPRGETTDVVTRLKVMADLLTYRKDLPQEGRVRGEGQIERRISTFPTLYGERAVVRIFAEQRRFARLHDLGLPAIVEQQCSEQLAETSGMLIICGPAGSGKTTTLYACLRELVSHAQGQRSIVSLEDPIEVVVEGVAQARIDTASGFDFARALRSVMRQDPEVIMIGEMRDPPTVEAAYAASLTGHLVLTTFHAGSCAVALSRLADMGIEPYMLRSGTRALLCQRLVRQLCDCKQVTEDRDQFLGLPVDRVWLPAGCDQCAETGYEGRMPLAELLTMPAGGELARHILQRADARQLEREAVEAGMVTRWERAVLAVSEGRTSPEEVRRVLGFDSGDALRER
jgi:general secretion pathway protein E